MRKKMERLAKKAQLLACNVIGTPVVIAESVDGITGCFYELFQNIKKLNVIKTYYENDFNNWLLENYAKRKALKHIEELKQNANGNVTVYPTQLAEWNFLKDREFPEWRK